MFFSWKNLYKKYPFLKNSRIIAICGPRNIGKTVDTYEYVINTRKGFTPTHKVAILRNTDRECLAYKQDFNNRFAGKFRVVGNYIYSLKQTTIEKKGETFDILEKDELVGYMAGISTYTNLKSIEAKDVKTIIYEEFNEDTSIGRNIYSAFINLLTTLERKNKILLLMLGNKDGFMSDFYVNWNIIPDINNDEDRIFPIGKVGFWIELGNKQFRDLKNDKMLSYELAMLDNRTKSYMMGGYLQNIDSLVVNFETILKNFEPQFYIAVQEQKYTFGKFNNNYALVSPWNLNYEFDSNLPVYSVDLISRLLQDSKILDDDDLKEVIEFVLRLIKNKELYFDSYDTLQLFKDLTVFLKELTN